MSINYCGGVIFKWYRDNFSHAEQEYSKKKNLKIYDVIMDLALKSKFPVQFLPYFEGSQTPRNNPDVTGAILGMTLRTKREDIIKGMFEGVTFDLRLNIEKMEQTGIKIGTLSATGGGARSLYFVWVKKALAGMTLDEGPVFTTLSLRESADLQLAAAPAGRPCILGLVNETGRSVRAQLVDVSGAKVQWLPIDIDAGAEAQLRPVALSPGDYEVRDAASGVTLGRLTAR
jgi:hypothetical protein